MEESKISFDQFCDPEFRRSEQMKIKSEATWVVFHELAGLINVSKFARDYFHKSQGWFIQKLNGYSVCNKDRSFTAEEYSGISKALRDVAARLSRYADEIDAAPIDKNE